MGFDFRTPWCETGASVFGADVPAWSPVLVLLPILQTDTSFLASLSTTMLLLDQHDPKSTRQVVVGSVGRVLCMKTKLEADRRLVSLPGCAVVTLPSLVACGHCPPVVPWIQPGFPSPV